MTNQDKRAMIQIKDLFTHINGGKGRTPDTLKGRVDRTDEIQKWGSPT
jgi:hypothetical protein